MSSASSAYEYPSPAGAASHSHERSVPRAIRNRSEPVLIRATVGIEVSISAPI